MTHSPASPLSLLDVNVCKFDVRSTTATRLQKVDCRVAAAAAAVAAARRGALHYNSPAVK